jgi:hypothetical protein
MATLQEKQAAITLLRDPEALAQLAASSGKTAHEVITMLNNVVADGPDKRKYHELSKAERLAMPKDVADKMVKDELAESQAFRAQQAEEFFGRLLSNQTPGHSVKAGKVTGSTSPSQDASNSAAAAAFTGGNRK